MAEHGHNEFMRMINEGPIKTVTEPIKHAVSWVVGHASISLGDEDTQETEPSASVEGLGEVWSLGTSDVCDNGREKEEDRKEK